VRILLVSLYGRGGMVHYTSQLANALAKDNEITIIIPTHTDLKYFESNINVKLIKAPPSIFLSLFYLLNIFAFIGLYRFIKSYDPHVIHFLNEHPFNNLIMLGLKYKTVLTCHDPVIHTGERSRFWMNLFQLNEVYQIKRVDKIIVHGKALFKDLIEQDISSDKIAVIPHGDYSFFKKFEESDIKENNSILFFGRIKPYKGIKYLIEAEKIISKKASNYKLIIAGEGDITPYNIDTKNNPRLIIINRYITDSEVAMLFKQSIMVVLPYLDASQSGIIPIAYAFKKPVVVTDVGSISEVVEDNVTGFIIPPGDANSLAGVILKLLNNDELRKNMGENAYKKMKEQMSWDKIAMETIRFYKEE
jgi:glycosyltransferase involved in cell wall biosynthesis